MKIALYSAIGVGLRFSQLLGSRHVVPPRLVPLHARPKVATNTPTWPTSCQALMDILLKRAHGRRMHGL
ncbi:hypothetical protein BVG81_004740 [Haliangium sp. UPWRP_2]|nr:hypothetical protein BVG81_004740 [Haliangium sp. UPWRP_2]